MSILLIFWVLVKIYIFFTLQLVRVIANLSMMEEGALVFSDNEEWIKLLLAILRKMLNTITFYMFYVSFMTIILGIINWLLCYKGYFTLIILTWYPFSVLSCCLFKNFFLSFFLSCYNVWCTEPNCRFEIQVDFSSIRFKKLFFKNILHMTKTSSKT